MTSNDINNPLVTNQIHPHQQLYRVIVHVKWAYPKLFETLISRLGGYAHADELRWMCWDPNGRYWTERGDGISIWRSDKTPVWKDFFSL